MNTPKSKAPLGARVKLRLDAGDPPPVPCVLLTQSGRRYDVMGIGGRKTLHCIVMDPDAPLTADDGPIFEWVWTARNKRVEP